jgi:hypothetical protein
MNTFDKSRETVKIVPITNPIPILQQESSNITTNTLIPKQTTMEINLPPSNNPIDDMLNNYFTKISKSFIDFFNDLFIKPDDTDWLTYLKQITLQNDRYYYIGIFFIAIAILISLLQQIY